MRARPWIPVLHGEWPLVAVSGGFAFLAVALAIVIRTWSDAIFLTSFDVSWIPWLFVASALVFVPATFGYAWIARHLGAVWLNTLLLGLFGLAAVACARFANQPRGVFVAVLVMSVCSPLANVICWNTILDRLDPRQARRLLPVIGGLSTLGAIIGGLAGGELAAVHGNEALVWLAFAFLVCMMPLPLLLSAPLRRSARRRGPGIRDGFRSLGRSRLIGIVATGTFLMALSTNVIDYQFKAYAQVSLPSEALGTFFARFYGATNLAVLLVQFGLAPFVLRRFGVGVAFALHPFVLALGASATLIFPGLGAVVALRFSDTVLKFTFHKNSTDLVLAPVRSQDRHQAMVFLKGVVYPLGGIAAGAVLASSSGLGLDPVQASGFWVMLLAALWLLVAQRVRQGYMEQIGRKLSIVIEPTRPPSGKPAAALAKDVRRRVIEIRRLQHRLREQERHLDEVDPDVSVAIQRALDALFATMAALVGDARAVEAAAERYLHGDHSERASAVELLDTLLDAHRIPDPADLLDSLSRDRTRGLLAPA